MARERLVRARLGSTESELGSGPSSLLPACVTLNHLTSLVSMPRSVKCGCYRD